MKSIIQFLAISALLSGCATTYEKAVRASYLGNGEYEIRSDGNKYTSEDSIRDFMIRKSFVTCASEGKGFKIVNSEDTSETTTTTINHGRNSINHFFPGSRARIRCEGEIDPKLEEQFRAPASQ